MASAAAGPSSGRSIGSAMESVNALQGVDRQHRVQGDAAELVAAYAARARGGGLGAVWRSSPRGRDLGRAHGVRERPRREGEGDEHALAMDLAAARRGGQGVPRGAWEKFSGGRGAQRRGATAGAVEGDDGNGSRCPPHGVARLVPVGEFGAVHEKHPGKGHSGDPESPGGRGHVAGIPGAPRRRAGSRPGGLVDGGDGGPGGTWGGGPGRRTGSARSACTGARRAEGGRGSSFRPPGERRYGASGRYRGARRARSLARTPGALAGKAFVGTGNREVHALPERPRRRRALRTDVREPPRGRNPLPWLPFSLPRGR